MKKNKLLFGILMILLLFISCAQTITITEIQEVNPVVYGFWGGLWHGTIVIFSWIGSLFSDDIAIYAVANNGGWYDFGYILGLLGIGGYIVSFIITVVTSILDEIFSL